jgi:sirohydrochlorin ferrochelatase
VAAANHPHTSCVVTAPLGIHSAMLQIIVDRIDQSL